MAPTPVRERTRRDIQEHATRLFALNGYEATSLHDIAAAVGCSKATVLYHFDGKPAILGNVIEPAAHALAELVDANRDLPPKIAQQRVIDGFIDLAVRFRGLIAVVHEVLPTFGDAPEFEVLLRAGRDLPRLLAGSDEPADHSLALFAIYGLNAGCRAAALETDAELRALLTVALHRLLLPDRP